MGSYLKNEWPEKSLGAPWVPMGPMGPMGPHGPHWAHGPNGFSLGPAWPEKSMLPGPQGPKKVEIYKMYRGPGLIHEPRVVFHAEFESGIGNGWKVDENVKNVNFWKN